MEGILVIHPHEHEMETMKRGLKGAGFQVTSAEDGESGLINLETLPSDLVIMIDDSLSGRRLCSRIRNVSDTPIIAVSARGDIVNRVTMLELGADACISQTVSIGELVARVRSLLRRRRIRTSNGPLIDPEGIEIWGS